MPEERSIPIAAPLRPWIADITTARARTDALVIEAPDHATTFTLRTSPGEPPQIVVMGPRTRALYYRARPGPSCLRLRLRPGRAGQLLGRPIRDLLDRAVPLSDLWDAAETLKADWHDPDALADALIRHASAAPDPGLGIIVKAAGMLSTTDVRTSARRLHVSERHLRNLFTRATGMPPKRFARIDRVRTVLEHGNARPWSELALATGYTDHSHLTAEFRAFMGVPPTKYFSGAIAPNTDCRAD